MITKKNEPNSNPINNSLIYPFTLLRIDSKMRNEPNRTQFAINMLSWLAVRPVLSKVEGILSAYPTSDKSQATSDELPIAPSDKNSVLFYLAYLGGF